MAKVNSAVATSPRRSGRERRKVNSIYDDARIAEEKERDDSSGDETEAESVRRPRDDSPDDEIPAPPTKKSKKAPNRSNSRPAKSRPSCIAHLSKSILPPDEQTPRISNLLSCLLQSHRSPADTVEFPPELPRTKYTDSLLSLTRRLLSLPANDNILMEVLLVNLLFRSVGGSPPSDLPLDRPLEDMDSDEWARIVTDLVDDMRHSVDGAILLRAADDDKDKKTRLVEGRAEYKLIYEEFFFLLAHTTLEEGSLATPGRLDVHPVSSLLGRLIELTPVGQPDIRYGATMASLSMCRGVLHASITVAKRLEVAERQFEASGRSTEKKESLKVRVDSLKRTMGDLEGVVDLVVQGLFVHRYRDSNPHIRTLCIEALSIFSIQRPDIFLTDKYLKYLGWMMHDKSQKVRYAALSGLLAPFLAVRNAACGTKVGMVHKIDLAAMEHVLAKFLKRVVESVVDVDGAVQEVAMELMLELLKKGFLDDLEEDGMWNLVNSRALAPDASPNVRRYALYFVLEQLEPFDDVDEVNETNPERKRAQKIDSIASFAAHTMTSGNRPVDNIPVHLSDYLVQSLREMPEHRSLVTDWSALLRAIKDDGDAATAGNVKVGERANVAKQRVLVRMLACAAREEVDSVADETFLNRDIDAEIGQIGEKKKTSKPSKMGREHESLSIALLKALPNLLIQFKGDIAIIPELASLPRFLIPTVFSLPQRKQDFLSLIKNLCEVYLSSSDDKILYNTALSLVSLSKGDHARVAESKAQLRNVVVELRNRLEHLVPGDDATVATSGFSVDPDQSEFTSQRSKIRRSTRKKSSENGVASSSQNSLTDDGETAAADGEYSIYLNLKRLRHLVKRCDLSIFFHNGDDANQLELLCNFVCDGLKQRLRACKPLDIRIVEADDETTMQKVISNPDMLAAIGKSVQEGLQFVLSVIAWSLDKAQKEDNLIVDKNDLINDENQGADDDEDVHDHVIIRLRDRLLTVLELCFAQYIPAAEERDEDEISAAKHSPDQLNFADYVQLAAGSVMADLRTLFPKEYSEASSTLLRSLAMAEDGRLVGAFVRFLGSKEHHLRDNATTEKENKSLPYSLLLPMGRAITANWNSGNRREAGMFLRHIGSSGPTASSIVGCCLKEMKKIDPVRLLESQMSSLRQSYENWVDDEPALDTERPTEEEMAEYEETERNHRDQFTVLEQRASHFSQALGVCGKLSDAKLGPALDGFVREGIRFSFSNVDAQGEDTLVLGSRLSFLSLLSKYSQWVKKNKKSKSEIQTFIDELEMGMRNHAEFDEVHEDDLDSLSKYRSSVGLKSLPDINSSATEKTDQVGQANDDQIADDESMDSVGELNITPSSLPRSMGRPSSSGTHKSSSSLNVSSLPTLLEGEEDESPPIDDDLDTPHSQTSESEEESRRAVVVSRKNLRVQQLESDEDDTESYESRATKRRGQK